MATSNHDTLPFGTVTEARHFWVSFVLYTNLIDVRIRKQFKNTVYPGGKPNYRSGFEISFSWISHDSQSYEKLCDFHTCGSHGVPTKRSFRALLCISIYLHEFVNILSTIQCGVTIYCYSSLLDKNPRSNTGIPNIG